MHRSFLQVNNISFRDQNMPEIVCFDLQFVFAGVVNNPDPQPFSISQIYQQSFNNTVPLYVQYVNIVRHVRLVNRLFTRILPNLKKKKIFQENENEDDDTGTIVSVTCECPISTLWPLHFCLGNVLSYISKSAFFFQPLVVKCLVNIVS